MATTVTVKHESGDPVTGIKVTVWLDYSAGQASAWTDGSGYAVVDAGPGQGTLYVDGQEVRKGYIADRVSVTYIKGSGYR